MDNNGLFYAAMKGLRDEKIAVSMVYKEIVKKKKKKEGGGSKKFTLCSALPPTKALTRGKMERELLCSPFFFKSITVWGSQMESSQNHILAALRSRGLCIREPCEQSVS